MSRVRGGRQITPQEVDNLKEKYRLVGGKTPLLSITLAQAKALRARLTSDEIRFLVYVGMKHWDPFIEDTQQKPRGPCTRVEHIHMRIGMVDCERVDVRADLPDSGGVSVSHCGYFSRKTNKCTP